ncbi:cation:proton antiporter [Natronolimnohabitans innermongolicus]|uniref:Sodium/hydrogen exchanger n=1 Tax=Natronolimnohabitans innermongolicus JCM 12255 TaxID=1227499 RepID=L9XAF7_9EURY|nr:cation:proton antiporter [Natronolimnohabitans innermongolicus]ELY57583.1 sodium/hydrogen exchanger [Natronolimnohabitans innermongolicus JCM 12255]
MYEILFALTLIFVLASILLIVAAQKGLPVIPFYLLAGIVAGAVIDETELLDLAQWGIAFLVFLFGVHVDFESVRERGRISVAVGTAQALLVGALTFGVGTLLGLDALNAAYVAIAAALSSSLVATSYLDGIRSARPTYERLAESIHFTEDVIGVLVILGLSAFVYAETPAVEQFGVAAGLLALALLIRYVVFHRLTAKLRGDSEVLMLVGISFVVGFIALAELANLSIIVGAFAAGIAVADDYPHSLELVDTVDDLEDFFTPILFVTVGALLTVPSPESLGYTAVLLAAVLVVNPLFVAAILVRSGFDGRTAILTGLTLDQLSVFSLFVAIEALAAETIARPVFDAIVLAAAATMVVATYTGRHADVIARRLRDRGVVDALGESVDDRAQVADGITDHVIVVDVEHGGWSALEACDALDRPVVVIEDNPATFETIQDECDNYVYGDVADERVWELARLEEAAAVVSLTPERDRAEAILDLETDVPRIVRVEETDAAEEFVERGAAGAIYPDAIAAERVGDDLEALLAGEISREEFAERGRRHLERASE